MRPFLYPVLTGASLGMAYFLLSLPFTRAGFDSTWRANYLYWHRALLHLQV